MFTEYSNFSSRVDTTFAIIIGISVFLLIAITGTIVYFIVKYNRNKHPVAEEITGSTLLEIIWTILPVILVLFMFWIGWKAFIPMRSIPKDAMNVKVHAQMWSWHFEYENGKVTDTLFVPADKAVFLKLESADVIHSLFIPAFRIKEDVVPGRNNHLWFKSSVPGTYNLFCSEYCGLRHSYMITGVKVMDPKEFSQWYSLAKIASDSPGSTNPALAGKLLFEQKGCLACHTLTGIRLVGPSLKDIFGQKVTVITNGKERQVNVDADYIRKSILEPDADIVKSYNKGLMVSFKGKLTDAQIGNIVAYIQSLSEEKKQTR